MELLSTHYKERVIPELKKELGIANIYALPKIIKVVVNVGIRQDQKTAELTKAIERTLLRVTGQKPVSTKAKKSIAAFKTRAGMDIGYKLSFLNILVNYSWLDKNGNLTIGIRENIVFPEIASDEVLSIHGLSITIATNANSREHGTALFKALGFPFEKKQ